MALIVSKCGDGSGGIYGCLISGPLEVRLLTRVRVDSSQISCLVLSAMMAARFALEISFVRPIPEQFQICLSKTRILDPPQRIF